MRLDLSTSTRHRRTPKRAWRLPLFSGLCTEDVVDRRSTWCPQDNDICLCSSFSSLLYSSLRLTWQDLCRCPPPPIYDRAIVIPSHVELILMHLPEVSLTGNTTRFPLTDWHSSPSPPADYSVGTCTGHDPSSYKYSVEDILQIILKSRKTRKTLKGQSEAVWPPYLEATMLKGSFINTLI